MKQGYDTPGREDVTSENPTRRGSRGTIAGPGARGTLSTARRCHVAANR